MNLKFTKMHGLGNDFVVFDGLERDIELTPGQVRHIADRHFGIGCDQVLLIQPCDSGQADIRYRIFNAAGAEVEQCGNGARCIAAYLDGKGLVTAGVVTAETINGIITIYMEDGGRVRVNMGAPRFEPGEIPIQAEQRQQVYSLELGSGRVNLWILSMGNPHGVLAVADVEQAPVATLGPEIQAHPLFPVGVNVGFMQIRDPAHIDLRVYERGVGETLACGSGACAAVVAGIMDNRLEKEITVGLKGGQLTVSWQGEGEPVWMTGPATTVYEGRITL